MKSAHHKNRFIHDVIGVLMQRFRGDDKKIGEKSEPAGSWLKSD
jgi:hypothetical protein